MFSGESADKTFWANSPKEHWVIRKSLVLLKAVTVPLVRPQFSSRSLKFYYHFIPYSFYFYDIHYVCLKYRYFNDVSQNAPSKKKKKKLWYMNIFSMLILAFWKYAWGSSLYFHKIWYITGNVILGKYMTTTM